MCFLSALEKCPFKKELREIKGGIKPFKKMLSIGRKTIKVLKGFEHEISENLQQFFGGSRLIAVAAVFFTIPKTINNAVKAVKAKEVAERVGAIYDTVANAFWSVQSISRIAHALAVLKIVSESAIEWTSTVSLILYPVTWVFFGRDLCLVKENVAFCGKLKKHAFTLIKKKNFSAKNLKSACEYVRAKQDKIYKNLAFSKDVQIKERMDRLLARLETGEMPKEEALLFFEKLQNRTSLMLGFTLTKTAFKVIGLVTSICSLFGVTSVALPIVSLAVAIIGLSMQLLHIALFPKNPFDETIWQNRLVYWVEERKMQLEATVKWLFARNEYKSCLA